TISGEHLQDFARTPLVSRLPDYFQDHRSIVTRAKHNNRACRFKRFLDNDVPLARVPLNSISQIWVDQTSDVKWIFISQVGQQVLLILTSSEPGTYLFNLRIVVGAESANIDLLHTLLSYFLLRLILPEFGEHGIHIIVEVTRFQSFPLISVEPNTF